MNSPLMIAAMIGKQEIIDYYIKALADVSIRNNNDLDALSLVTLLQWPNPNLPSMMKSFLKTKEFDVNYYNKFTGLTLLHVCAVNFYNQPLEILISAGANLHLQHELIQDEDQDGVEKKSLVSGKETSLTPLQMACISVNRFVWVSKPTEVDGKKRLLKNLLNTMQSLLDGGSWLNLPDARNRLPMQLLLDSFAAWTEAMEVQLIAAGSQGPSTSSIDQLLDQAGLLLEGAGEGEGGGREDSLKTPATPPSIETETPENHLIRVYVPVLQELVCHGARCSEEPLSGMGALAKQYLATARESWNKQVAALSCPDQLYYKLVFEVGKKKWLADSFSKCCLQCHFVFTTTRRRHHCRACGVLVCHACSTKKVMFPPLAGAPPLDLEDSPSSHRPASMAISSSTSTSTSPAAGGKFPARVCDPCYNRIHYMSSFAMKQHKRLSCQLHAELIYSLNSNHLLVNEVAQLLDERGKALQHAAKNADKINENAKAYQSGTKKLLQQTKDRNTMWT